MLLVNDNEYGGAIPLYLEKNGLLIEEEKGLVAIRGGILFLPRPLETSVIG